METESRSVAIVNCLEIVTLAGPGRPRIRGELKQLAVITDGGVLVRDGRIEAIGPQREIERQMPPGTRVVDAVGRVVLPGFVDAHTHPVFAGTRIDEYELRAAGASYQQIAEAGGGIRSTVRKTRASSEDELVEISQRYCSWFLRTGTTTVEAKSGYGLSLDSELKMLRVIRRLDRITGLQLVPTFLGAHEVPDEYRGRTAEYARTVTDEMLPKVAEQRLAKYCDVFCEPAVFDVPTATRILTSARQLGFELRVHADQLSTSGAAQMAAALGAVTADHLEHIDEQGISALAFAGVQPVLLPGSVYTLGSRRFAPARAIIDAGLAVVLATDFNPGSSPTPSIPLVLSIACTHMQMTPAEALTAATINAAHSLGLGYEIGSLEAGKRADFVIHDVSDFREIPYFAGLESATSVYVGGELVSERGYMQVASDPAVLNQ